MIFLVISFIIGINSSLAYYENPKAILTIVDNDPFGLHYDDKLVNMTLDFTNTQNTTQSIYADVKLQELTQDLKNPITEESCIPVITKPNHTQSFNYSRLLPAGDYQLWALPHEGNGCEGEQVGDSVEKNFVVQPVQNYWFLVSAIASAIIGVGTIGTLVANTYFSRTQVHEMRNQNQLYRDQFSYLNRPWISVSNIDPMTHQPNFLGVPLKNYGKTPAVNIRTKYLVKEKNITVDDLRREGKPVETADMTPDEIWSETLEMLPQTYAKMLTTDDCYFGLYIEYSYENNKTGVTTIICQIKKSVKEIF